ncbi:MAG: hypothetical protein K8E24_012135 [Methanobacterium paludis]|nr:hypothetical protein [Methanobacterium paludis]
MADITWVINGVQPFKVMNADVTAFPKITLHCAAHYTDARYDSPIEEIRTYKSMACNTITNEPNMAGGTTLETSIDGQIIPISDGIDSWLGALYYPQYTPDDMSNTMIKFDLIFELQLVNKEIIPDAPTNPTTDKPYNLITYGYKFNVTTKNEATQLLGTFTFNWDGTGKVYIASDWLADPATDRIGVDDDIIITNGDGNSITQHCSTSAAPFPAPDVNITSLLSEGSNEITIAIKDVYGTSLSCGTLFMIQV